MLYVSLCTVCVCTVRLSVRLYVSLHCQVVCQSALSGCLSVCTVCVCTVRLPVSLYCLRLHCQVACQSVLSASALSGCLLVWTVCVCTVRLSVSLYGLRLHCQVVCQSVLYSRLVRHPEGGGGWLGLNSWAYHLRWSGEGPDLFSQADGLCSSQIFFTRALQLTNSACRPTRKLSPEP